MMYSTFSKSIVSLLAGLLFTAFFSVEGVHGTALGEIVNKVKLTKRDVWVPAITSPSDGTTWMVGKKAEVIWDASSPPDEITNPIGKVVLRTGNGFVKGQGGLNEPLASNFSLFDGNVTFTVPNVQGRTDYQVVLFGDSGNESPFFTIVGMVLDPALQNIGPF